MADARNSSSQIKFIYMFQSLPQCVVQEYLIYIKHNNIYRTFFDESP